MYDEDYVLVQAWDDQTGMWFDVDEAKDVDQARKMIEQLRVDPDNFTIYSIVEHKRTISRRY